MAVLFLFALAYAARTRLRVTMLERTVRAIERRETDVLQAVRVFTAASRESSRAVLASLDQTLRVLDPALDAVLVFAQSDEDLACVYAGGRRADHFEGARIRADAEGLPAKAARCGHRVELAAPAERIVPTDRAALAVPMLLEDSLNAVVYAASREPLLADPDVLVMAVEQAAAPYAIAREREADRAHATYDSLTGLYTPRALRAMLQEELRPSGGAPLASLALWFVDTDHFKRVNDSLGHAAGDAVLQRMARLLLEHALQGVDVAARNGGDEFCAVLRNVQKISAIERAQRFCDAVRDCDFGVNVAITASIGVAAYPYDASDASELLEMADAAMYHSKRSGRNRVSFALGQGAFAVYM